jgi:hypothetical protein
VLYAAILAADGYPAKLARRRRLGPEVEGGPAVRFRRFGGDNRDQGKGFVFYHLAGLLRDFRVDPMVTDEGLPPGPGRRAFVEA